MSKVILFSRVGARLARKFFELRGNHSEMHVTESELAEMLTGAARLSAIGCLVPMSEISSEDKMVLTPKNLLDDEDGGAA